MNNIAVAALPVELPTDLAVPDLLDSLAEGAYITDLNRRILCWNQAAERITGWSAEEVVGRTCFDNILVHVDKLGCALCGQDRCPLYRSIITGHSSSEPVLIYARRKTGVRVPMEVSVGPIRNLQGQIIGGIEVFRDMTESLQDLLRAKVIQDIAMDSPLPPDDRVTFEVCYLPRNIVGGDFYRIEPRGPDHYALMVADATGHGVAGALCAMQLGSLWNDHQKELSSPARLLEVFNQRLHPLVHEAGYFATAVCANYNAANGQLYCVRAGHPAPLLFRANGRVEAVAPAQLALGLFPRCQYQETTLQLEPGDALLVFTDGAVELFDSAEHELGTEGLKEFVREQTVGRAPGSFHAARLKEQLLRFSNRVQLPDDLTLLIVRRKS